MTAGVSQPPFFGVFLILMSLSQSLEYCKEPFGIRMCLKRCQGLVGCSSYMFFEHREVCCIGQFKNSSSSKFGRSTVFNLTQDPHTTVNETCPMYSRMVRTRQNIVICIPDEARKVSTPVKVNTKKIKEHLLLALCDSDEFNQIHQFFPHNHSIQLYPSLKMYHVSALAYNSKLRKIYVASKMPNRILSSTLYGNVSAVLTEQMKKVIYMAVDETRDILFLTVFAPWWGIAKIADKKYQQLVTFSSPVYGIAVDSKGKTIFTCDQTAVYNVTYSGGKGKLFMKDGNGPMALHPDGGVLYYMTPGVQLMARNIARRSTKMIWKMQQDVFGLAADKTKIYVTLRGPIISVIYESGGMDSKHFSPGGKVVISCLVNP